MSPKENQKGTQKDLPRPGPFSLVARDSSPTRIPHFSALRKVQYSKKELDAVKTLVLCKGVWYASNVSLRLSSVVSCCIRLSTYVLVRPICRKESKKEHIVNN